MSVLTSQYRWPSLARDLAILSVPGSPVDLQDIFNTYDLDKASLTELLQNPTFVKLFEKEARLCEQNGEKAAVKYRATTLSQALSEKLFTVAVQGGMKDSDALKLLDLLLKTAGLLTEDKTTVAVQTNVNMKLPLPHVPKLAHCFPIESADPV